LLFWRRSIFEKSPEVEGAPCCPKCCWEYILLRIVNLEPSHLPAFQQRIPIIRTSEIKSPARDSLSGTVRSTRGETGEAPGGFFTAEIFIRESRAYATDPYLIRSSSHPLRLIRRGRWRWISLVLLSDSRLSICSQSAPNLAERRSPGFARIPKPPPDSVAFGFIERTKRSYSLCDRSSRKNFIWELRELPARHGAPAIVMVHSEDELLEKQTRANRSHLISIRNASAVSHLFYRYI